MYIRHTHTLSPRETQALIHLTNQCRLSDNLTLSFPAEGDEYWILEDECKTVAAYFAVCKIDKGLWECSAFTCPDRRGKGYFSQLLDRVWDYSLENGEPVLAFVTDKRCPQALNILKHLNAAYSHSEYLMRLPLSSSVGFQDRTGCMELQFYREPDAFEEYPMEEGTVTVRAWPGASFQTKALHVAYPTPPKHGNSDSSCGILSQKADSNSTALGPPAVTCHLMIQGSSVYLFALETRPEYRRQGIALQFLNQLAQWLGARGYKALLLQVSETNEGALCLYKKAGFSIVEALAYYLY